MKRFLICSGINGEPDALETLETIVRERSPDGVLFAGGFLARCREYAPSIDSEFGYTLDQSLFMDHCLSTLGNLNALCAIIPGVFDAPIELFLQLGMSAERDHPRLHLAHVTPVLERDIAIFGLGACINSFTNTNLGNYSYDLAKYYLRPLKTITAPRSILLLPEPLQSWHGDAESRKLTDSLIVSCHPKVCVLGITSTGQQIQRIGPTLVIIPGNLSDGHAAWLDWDRPTEDQVELLTFSKLKIESPLPSLRPDDMPDIALSHRV